MARRTSLEVQTERAEVARLKRQAAIDEAVALLARQRGQTLANSFHDASRGRLHTGTRPMGGSAQAHRDGWARDKLRRECQEAYRNNPIAQAIVDRIGDILIGDGPRLAVLTDDETFNKEAQRRFDDWSMACDVTGRYSLADLCLHLVSAWHTDGRLLLLKTKAGLLQEIEDERVVNPNGTADTATCKGGVRIDEAGRPVGYHVRQWRPDGSTAGYTTTEIGAAFVIDAGNPRSREPALYSPEPALFSVLNELKLIDESVEATAAAYRIATLLSAIITTEHPGDMMESMIAASQASDYTTTPASGDPAELELQPGMIQYAPSGTTVSQVKPEHPGTNVDRFAWMVVQLVAARLGCSIDLTHYVMDGNFASTRARMAVTWRAQAAARRTLTRVLTEVSRWKIAGWIAQKKLPEVEGWDRHEWQLAAMPQLDFGAEVKSVRDALDGGLLDYATASERLGLGDWHATMTSRREQEAVLAEAGVAIVRPGAGSVGGPGTQPGDVGDDGQPLNTGA